MTTATVHVVRGQQAWKRPRKGWSDWLAIGEALAIGRSGAMAEAGTSQSKGARYNVAFGEWLERYGFAGIDQNTRKRLFDVLEHRAEIEAWRATLPQKQRLKLNHPVAIWRRWRASVQDPTTTYLMTSYFKKFATDNAFTSPLMRDAPHLEQPISREAEEMLLKFINDALRQKFERDRQQRSDPKAEEKPKPKERK